MKATQDSSATFLHHAPCPKCDSSDALSVYSDGHTYCFSCETYGAADGEPNSENNPFTSVQTEDSSEQEKIYEKAEVQALKTRRISQDTCRRYGYKVGNNLQLAPYYRNGSLVALKTRDKHKKFRIVGDGSNLPLFGQQLQNVKKLV